MKYVTNWRAMRSAMPRPGLRNSARQLALSALSLVKRRTSVPTLRLMYCHHVFDDQIEMFEQKIRYLSGVGRFISADEVLDVIHGRRELDEHLFHLSFDDGFRNVVTNALPVLVEHGVPSTFFVPSAIISANEQTVRDYCLNTTNYPGVIEVASWDDLHLAQVAGMAIGSHTRTHARFTEISSSNNRLKDEICRSKEEIETKLGTSCDHISWPYGQIKDADSRSLEFVRSAKYSACFGAFRGKVTPGQTDPFYIPRHHFESYWPMAHFKCFADGAMENQPH